MPRYVLGDLCELGGSKIILNGVTISNGLKMKRGYQEWKPLILPCGFLFSLFAKPHTAEQVVFFEELVIQRCADMQQD
jgi:hypothetical protein